MSETVDAIVIGGGIAGVAAAARLAEQGLAPLVFEAEDQLGSHATGRSAAIRLDNYGPTGIRALTRASKAELSSPDEEFWPAALLEPRGHLLLARPGEEGLLDDILAIGSGIEEIPVHTTKSLVPIIDVAAIARASYEKDAQDIDVETLLRGFARLLRSRGGRIETGVRVTAIERSRANWRVETRDKNVEAPILINAAGAWGDEIARMAGIHPLGLVPKRRSAAIVPVPGEVNRWAFFGSVAEDWYARPIGVDKLMVSPADAEPVSPHDAWADDMVLAEGIERFAQMITIEINRVEGSWAGLRSFVEDGEPVIGFDPAAEGFFWLVGQGGYGIQTAPAIARLAASLITGKAEPDFPASLIDTVSPGRFSKG
ncbi:NAD(P)/FAD-dependent oxidoreductase [Cucumibacter marinus]|uniref:NAD(P)/FAD-dependent oxidoreductase n=1 Tax=Cucumibacter marinus TaxID=1121252 RepID=UPI000413A4B7|nr:FAD-dependent oxidoreductase [Cucumibacter marinus]